MRDDCGAIFLLTTLQNNTLQLLFQVSKYNLFSLFVRLYNFFLKNLNYRYYAVYYIS